MLVSSPESPRRRLYAIVLALFASPLLGCGGEQVDESEPAEIDPIMEEEIEASDQYMEEMEAKGEL